MRAGPIDAPDAAALRAGPIAAAEALTVTDDGTGPTETIPDRGRVGTGSMRRAITGVGASFRVRHARPRGVVVEADVPKGWQ